MDGNALATQTDRDISEIMQGRSAVGEVTAYLQAQAAHVGARTPLAPSSNGIPYSTLRERHPDYLADFWSECRALYAGGQRLLRDEKVMDRLFPKNGPGEANDLYQQRRARAFYLGYPGEIIDHLLAGLAQDPLRLSAGRDDKGEEQPLPSWWDDFSKDVSPPGGQKVALHAFATDVLRELFLTQTAWILVDLPARDPNAPIATRLDEERAGLRDPYLCLYPSETVVDWELDEETGELAWVLCYWQTRRRADLRSSRNMITERWQYWDRSGWQRYEHTYDPAKPPPKDTIVPLIVEGAHSFGVVPFVRLVVPDGLYAMGKLHSPAREHFNKRNAVAHAENMSLFSVLYEFNGPEQGSAFVPQAQQDPRRSVNQVRGQGYTQIRGADDDARYIGPDPGPFREARESCAELMREMHRVMFSMALSANMDSAALQRSGDSKAQDGAQIAAILAKVGEILRDGFDVIIEMVARVRGEDGDAAVSATGLEKFDGDSIASSIDEAVNLLNGVPLRSPTFLRLYLYRLYKRALGPDVSNEDLEEISEELATMVTAEALLMQDGAVPPDGSPPPDGGDRPPPPDESDSEPPAPKPAAAPKRRTMIATSSSRKRK